MLPLCGICFYIRLGKLRIEQFAVSEHFVVWPDNRDEFGILMLHTNTVTPVSVMDGQTEINLTV